MFLPHSSVDREFKTKRKDVRRVFASLERAFMTERDDVRRTFFFAVKLIEY